MSALKLTLVQPRLQWEAPRANFGRLQQMLASTTASDLIVLPEMFPTGFSMNPADNYEEPEGPAWQFMQQLAREKNSAVTGSVIVKDEGNYYNRLYFHWPNGEYRHYDKRHLFTYAGEEKVYTRGEEQLIVEHRGWKIMPLVCYDLRFPVWCRNTSEAHLQLYVANWPERRSLAWKSLLQARAIENMCCVAGLNRVGEDDNGVDHSGDSGVYDALGKPLLQLTPHQEEVATVELQRQAVEEARERFRFLNDRDSFYFSEGA